MIFVASGQVRMRVSFAVYEVTAPAVLLLSNLEPHSVEAVTGEYERYTVTISPEGALGVLDDRLLSGFIAHSEEFPRLISLTREEALKYQSGETIAVSDNISGYVLPAFEGLALGFGKASGGQIKNHYPKGLRRP